MIIFGYQYYTTNRKTLKTMFDQLSELVKQFGGEAVVNNPAVPNEQNDAVMQEAGGSILSGLKDKLLSELKGLTYRQAKRILDDLQLTIQLKSVVQ